MAQRITAMKAIRDFFGHVTMDEMKALTKEDRAELAPACAQALGCELEAAATV